MDIYIYIYIYLCKRGDENTITSEGELNLIKWLNRSMINIIIEMGII
jgi:hypothetical protein